MPTGSWRASARTRTTTAASRPRRSTGAASWRSARSTRRATGAPGARRVLGRRSACCASSSTRAATAAPDLWNFFDPEGRLEKQEQDADRDGKVDTWVSLDAGERRRAPRAARHQRRRQGRHAGAATTRSGATVELEEDRSFDGKPDRMVEFEAGKPRRFAEDATRTASPNCAASSTTRGASTRRSATPTATVCSTCA